MLIKSINNLIVNFNDLNSNVIDEVKVFVEVVLLADTIQDIQQQYDELIVNGNEFSYAIKQNYQHVVCAVIGKEETGEVHLTLQGYD